MPAKTKNPNRRETSRTLDRRARNPKSTSTRPKPKLACPIVGVGGSAGGFEAAIDLLGHLPQKTGMAYVIVQHLDPYHASRLPSLLGRATQMPVVELSQRTRPQPDTVYVQPPNKCVICKNGDLTLIRRVERMSLAIDHFFESLAEEQGRRAIGVLLSGSGSDGTAGLRAIKAATGFTFAQDEESAKFPSMPRNAIASGFVDAALSPKEIAAELRRIAGHPYIKKAVPEKEEQEPHIDLDDLSRIFLELRKHTGVDIHERRDRHCA
ncbi:MAG TPA: chemotaxis protein CheB [Chthoniobacterales bacterium]|nr:chemotaxis protein CheB [Chthoniobacterales bacterium]